MHFPSYNEQIKYLTQSIMEMGELVGNMVIASYASLNAKDDAHKQEVKLIDKKVNNLDHSINEQAIAMLAFRSPMGDDLRFVTSALGIASDLERSGDLAKNIAKRSLKLGDYNPLAITAKMGEMVAIIVQMIKDAIHAIENRNPEIAIEVWRKDKEVDRLYNEILKSLQEEMRQNTSAIAAITQLMFASKNFERIADYITSLARTVYYVTTGKQADKQVLRGTNG